jgi:hypothetical protein
MISAGSPRSEHSALLSTLDGLLPDPVPATGSVGRAVIASGRQILVDRALV